MLNWKETFARPGLPILDVIQELDRHGLQIALVVDEEGKLLGTITDGDIRRAILRGVSLVEPATAAMNSKPMTASPGDSPAVKREKMRRKGVYRLPILDSDGRVVGLEFYDETTSTSVKPNWVVLMAGGTGSRLWPLTEDTPKPLLKVGSKPILETILENFVASGFKKFLISVNYKAEMLETHFKDGSEWGVSIEYIREDKTLGTAGCLSLLPSIPEHPLIVMNGDILTNVNFEHLLSFHAMQKATATMCVRKYEFQVPYGVVDITERGIESISEKPVQSFFVNAGIYALNPEVLKFLPRDSRYDMTSLFQKCIAERMKAAAFPIREYWLDVGRHEDLRRASGEFAQVFGSKND